MNSNMANARKKQSVVQLGTDEVFDSNESGAESSTAISGLFIAAIVVSVIASIGGVSIIIGSAVAAKNSTSVYSFAKNTLLNFVLGFLVIMSLVITYLNSSIYEKEFRILSNTNITFVVIFVLLAIIYKFAFPFDMGTHSKILVHLIIFHVIYWGGWWIYDTV